MGRVQKDNSQVITSLKNIAGDREGCAASKNENADLEIYLSKGMQGSPPNGSNQEILRQTAHERNEKDQHKNKTQIRQRKQPKQVLKRMQHKQERERSKLERYSTG